MFRGRKPPPPTEFEEAARFAAVCKMHESKHPDLQFLFAVPNGGKRSKAAAGKAKAEGVKCGVPDYLFPKAMGGYMGLVIELKRVKGGQVSADQNKFINHFAGEGWMVVVAKGWVEAWDAVKFYLNLGAKK